MKKLFLCGHTGSDNRGCEAIVRSTANLFFQAGLKDKPVVATFASLQDEERGLQELVELLPYKLYSSKAQRAFFALKRKFTGNPFAGQEKVQQKLWSKITKDDLSLTVGGDTYCYGAPTVSMAQNFEAIKKGAVSVLWCCSVESSALSGKVLEDVKRYSFIVARESVTADNLIKAGVEKDKVILCCDPAFTLSRKEVSLPENFIKGNTVGINLSSLVDTPEVFEAAVYAAEKILNCTDMNICLIPHVYNAKNGTGDVSILKRLYQRLLKFESRVSFVNTDLSCTELKYIISQCRFFVGARTHSIVAAYSTGVPALALGYSVKSQGIAKDIFGSTEDYVLSYKDVKCTEDIYRKLSAVMDKEETIKTRYKEIMGDYVDSVRNVVKDLSERYLDIK